MVWLNLISIIRAPEIVSSLIGAGVAFLVFYLTSRSDKKKEKEKQKEIYEYRIQYLSSLVESSIKYIENTIENLEVFCDKIKEDNITIGLLTYNPNYSFDRIQELIKNEGYFSAYIATFGKAKTYEYHEFAEIVDYFKAQIEQIFDMNEKVHMRDYERKIKFAAITNEALNLTMSPSIIENLNEYNQKELNNIIVEFHKKNAEAKSEKVSLELHYNLMRHLLDVFINYHSDGNYILLLEKIKKASQLFNEIKLQNEETGKNINQIKDTLEKALKEYAKITGNLRNEK